MYNIIKTSFLHGEIMEKTNALRLLDVNKIEYKIHKYDSNITDGELIANILNEPAEQVFKTLVTISNTREHFVFIVPVNNQLDLKKAAKAANVKSIEMIKQKELYPLTGYIHGGCSPVGMKVKFKTFIDETALLFDKIFVSAGKVGMQMEVDTKELIDFVNIEAYDITIN